MIWSSRRKCATTFVWVYKYNSRLNAQFEHFHSISVQKVFIETLSYTWHGWISLKIGVWISQFNLWYSSSQGKVRICINGWLKSRTRNGESITAIDGDPISIDTRNIRRSRTVANQAPMKEPYCKPCFGFRDKIIKILLKNISLWYHPFIFERQCLEKLEFLTNVIGQQIGEYKGEGAAGHPPFPSF